MSKTPLTSRALIALLVGSLLMTGCGAAPMVPRLVVTGRLTTHPRGIEHAAIASLRVPLPTEPRTVPPLEASSLVLTREQSQLLTSYAGEPTVERLVELALEASTLDPRRAREARERARLSGLLPVVRADVRRGSGWDLRTQQSATVDSAVLANGDSWSVVGSVTLRLDRLLFAREETSLLSEERRLEEARLRLVAELVRLYFERRRLQLERDRRGETDLATEARIAELGAMLDSLTGGGLSAPRGR